MSVIPITLFFSLLLAGVFVALFAREHASRRMASAERDSLLPLNDETPHPLGPAARSAPDPDEAHEHEQDHATGGCGCRHGERPPCPGCLRRTSTKGSVSS